MVVSRYVPLRKTTRSLWIVGASDIYCNGIGRPDLFVFPWDQWLQVLPYWRANWWVTFWVVVSAAMPTAIFGLSRFLWLKRRQSGGPVYGKTQWATPQEMASSNIVRKQRNA
jgi:hypothetical protein